MMNFFTKLLTPVFIALGMVNPAPVIETPTPDIQVQQELIELRQRVQEFENRNDQEAELEPKSQETKEKVIEIKPAEVKKENLNTLTIFKPESKPTETLIDASYLDKLELFNVKVAKLDEESSKELDALDLKYDSKIAKVKQEIIEINKMFDDYEQSITLGFVPGFSGGGNGAPSSVTNSKMQVELNRRSQWLLSTYPVEFEALKLEMQGYLDEKMEAINKSESNLIKESKELQTQWNIKTEDWLY